MCADRRTTRQAHPSRRAGRDRRWNEHPHRHTSGAAAAAHCRGHRAESTPFCSRTITPTTSHGIDDIRALSDRSDAPLDMYGPPDSLERLAKRFAYIFDDASKRASRNVQAGGSRASRSRTGESFHDRRCRRDAGRRSARASLRFRLPHRTARLHHRREGAS